MPISEQAWRIRANADRAWLAKQQREYQKWEEARTFFPSTLRDREVASPVAKGPGKLLSDAERGHVSKLGGVAKQEGR
jgi:hypothetical protein